MPINIAANELIEFGKDCKAFGARLVYGSFLEYITKLNNLDDRTNDLLSHIQEHLKEIVVELEK